MANVKITRNTQTSVYLHINSYCNFILIDFCEFSIEKLTNQLKNRL